MARVEIKDETLEGIEERVGVSEFGFVEEYINFVLEEVLRQVKEGEQSVETEFNEDYGEGEMSEEDEEAVKDRLRDLGYM